MAFARTARTKFDKIVVSLHERHHAKKNDALRCLVETGRLQTYRPQKKINPFGGRELRATFGKYVQHIRARHLDGPQR